MKSYFELNHNPDAKDLKQLSQKTGLSKRVLQVWFQNARAKFRRGQSNPNDPAETSPTSISITPSSAAAAAAVMNASGSMMMGGGGGGTGMGGVGHMPSTSTSSMSSSSSSMSSSNSSTSSSNIEHGQVASASLEMIDEHHYAHHGLLVNQLNESQYNAAQFHAAPQPPQQHLMQTHQQLHQQQLFHQQHLVVQQQQPMQQQMHGQSQLSDYSSGVIVENLLIT